MGLGFLRDHGALRVRNYEAQPMLLDDGLALEENEPDETLDWGIETDADNWNSIDVLNSGPQRDWRSRPQRFVDGKDVGRTVAWLQSAEGYPVPVRLSEIGAVVMRNEGGALCREFSVVERVVSMIADLFPWDEVEGFAIALREHGFRFLPAQQPKKKDMMFDFERMRHTTQSRSNDEMYRLERQALARATSEPTVVDGQLEKRAGTFAEDKTPVVGLIKTHSRNYLHAQGWRVFYNLKPGERTPAFQLNSPHLSVISWYLRLAGQHGELPNWGVVRLEIPERFFQTTIAGDWNYLDQLSHILFDYRSHDSGYSRAAVSIHPIQRAEESLGALFTDADLLINRFYHLTNL